MKEAKEEYDKKISEYSGSMERLRNELADLSKRKRSLMEIRDEKKLMLKMDEIMADQNRVKEYIHEYVTQIVLYKPDPSWVLVVVNFLDGSEFGENAKKGTVRRERVCAMEIWCECFGKSRESLKKADSYEIEGILYKLGNWVKYEGNASGKCRIPGYGIQKAYVRVSNQK